MLSGWNCTPNIGRLAWRSPMITPIGRTGGDGQRIGQGVGINGQAVVAGGVERVGHTGENAGAVMIDRRDLAMHGHRRAHHPPPENLPDGLMAQTDAKDRHPARRLGNQVAADPGLIGGTGPRGDDNGLGPQRKRVGYADRIIAIDVALLPQIPQVMDEVEVKLS